MIGVRVGLQDPDNGVPLFGNQGEEGVGRQGGDCPGAVVVVQDRVNDGGILGLWICDDILERACSCLEDGMNDGLDRRMVGLTGGRLPTPTAACDDGRERVDGSTKWCTWRNPPPRWTSRRRQPAGLMNPPAWMRCDRRSLKVRMLVRSENGQGGQGRSQKSGLDLASQRVGDARFGLECVHVVCDGGDGRRQGKRANLRNTVLVVDEVSLCIRRDSSRPRQPVSPWRSGLLGTSGSTQWVELGSHVLSQPVMALFSLPHLVRESTAGNNCHVGGVFATPPPLHQSSPPYTDVP